MTLRPARQRLEERLSHLQTQAKKSLGQNFLVSDHVIAKILGAAQGFSANSLIEVGPGLGALTDGLRQFQTKFEVIELDSVFARYWQEQGLTVYEADALQFDWSRARVSEQLLVSNLPYQISSSLVVDRCLDEQPLIGMILMFQKEVAQRIRARQGDSLYGFLSVLSQTFWAIDLLLEASSHDFFPPPKVASRVLVFRPRSVEITSRRSFLRFLKGAFLHPRKLLVSNLQEYGLGTKEEWREHLTASGFNEKVRAEELTVPQFVDLYKRKFE